MKNKESQENKFNQQLRPQTWDEYIGQEIIKENLHILLTAAEQRKQSPEHLLFYGPPGLGKTTLAYLIAIETGMQMKTTSGPAIEKVGDLASILTNIEEGSILFIDEIHRLNKQIEEILYPAMESGFLDIIIGKGPSARTIQLELPSFTLIAATTRVAMISSPLQSRFSGGVFKLSFYTKEEIAKILEQSAKKLEINVDKKGISEIALRSRSTPRRANYFLKRCRDYVQVNNIPFDEKAVIQALSLIGIDELGLTQADRDYLSVIIEKFNGGPVGLKTLTSATSEEDATIEEFIEPYLVQTGLLELTSRGRIVTKRAYEHLGY